MLLIRNIIILFLIPCALYSSEFKNHVEQSGDTHYIQTPEDMKRLGFFSALYDMAAKREAAAGEIPKILHFIWLGPKPFPEESLPRIKKWIDHHSGWKVRFWTDLGAMAPDDRMEVRTFEKFPLDDVKQLYFSSDNYGERSQLLRYMILLSEGGVYVDHDVENIQSIDLLREQHDFFCGMEVLGNTVLSSSVYPSPHLIAATAQHPILKASKHWLHLNWERLGEQYVGTGDTAVFNRVQHRTTKALFVGIKEAYARSGRKDLVFPPNYFSLQSADGALFATHAHSQTWHQEESSCQKKIEWLTQKIYSDQKWIRFLLWIAVGFNVILLVLLFLPRNKRSA